MKVSDRLPPIPIPRGGFKTNEEDAKWLELTILRRTEEMLAAVGIKASIAPVGLYELLLNGLNSATNRGCKAAEITPPALVLRGGE